MSIVPLLGSVWFFIAFRPAVLEAASCMTKIGPGHSAEEKLTGCIGIALIVLGLVCFARLVAAERTNDK